MNKYLYGFFTAAVFVLLVGCELKEESPFVDEDKIDVSLVMYKIPSGSHHAIQSFFHPLTTNQIKFKARFNNSAIYQTIATENQEDINKLYGMSDCATNHQLNSARFGWRWFKNALEIWAYTYANGTRKFAFVGTVPLNSMNSYEILFTDTSYTFKLNNLAISLPRHCPAEAKGYKLYPYFGGDEVAPHEITIEIQDLN